MSGGAAPAGCDKPGRIRMYRVRSALSRAPTNMTYDVIVIGAGVGGAAAAYHLTQLGKKVLLLGQGLPPANAAGNEWPDTVLLRLAPDAFRGDAQHKLAPWPIRPAELEPFYEAAEHLLAVHRPTISRDLRQLAAKLQRHDPCWLAAPLPCSQPMCAGTRLLDRALRQGNLQLAGNLSATSLLGAPGEPRRIIGVACADGSRHHGRHVILAAGTLESPRLLREHLERDRLLQALPVCRNIGRHLHSRLVTALLALSARTKHGPPGALLLRHGDFPHSSVQCRDWPAADLQVRVLPPWLPQRAVDLLGRRSYALVFATEGGPSPEHIPLGAPHSIPAGGGDASRNPALLHEHRTLLHTLRGSLMRNGYFCMRHSLPPEDSLWGTLAAGSDPAVSVVDGDGRVHGMENLYVVDGSALPRSGSSDPTLTICAWALRCASQLAWCKHPRGHSD